jgi:hypothetical protein
VLKYLNLRNCENLKYLPPGVDGFTSLENLCTMDCSKLIWAKQTASAMARALSLCDIIPTVGASLEDICTYAVLTNRAIDGKIDGGMELPHNKSTLTNLKILSIDIENVKTLPAGMAYSLKQLQELSLYSLATLEYIPKSFTTCGPFPALVK